MNRCRNRIGDDASPMIPVSSLSFISLKSGMKSERGVSRRNFPVRIVEVQQQQSRLYCRNRNSKVRSLVLEDVFLGRDSLPYDDRSFCGFA